MVPVVSRRYGGAGVQAGEQAGAQAVGFGELDGAALSAGPGFAVLCDARGMVGACRFDHERGAALEDIDPAGWVS